ncbi:MAG: hypothetical protein QNK37_04070 [Acidobacteriota bacterium]|nr:hypothetical protein [Acidobacteriota bacterium]
MRLLFCWMTLCSVLPLSAQRHDPVTPPFNQETMRQFDFWIGAWSVNLRIRQEDGSWPDSVKAEAHIFRILDGKAILELWDSQPIKGFSLRYFDPDQKKWVLWLNWPQPNRSFVGSLSGSFQHGRGEFFSTSKNAEGKETISRYTFSDIAADRLRWDDAFSNDGGKTWSHGWIMEFSRTSDLAPWPNGLEAHTFATEEACTEDSFLRLKDLAGKWRGTWTADGKQEPITLESHRALRGCSLIQFLTTGNHKEFGLFTWHSGYKAYARLSLDNRPGTPAAGFIGDYKDNRWVLQEQKGTRRTSWLLEGDQLTLTTEEQKGQDWIETGKGVLKR